MIDKIRQIKYSRLKPEEKWFLEMITDLKVVKSDKQPNIIKYKKNRKILFKHNLENNEILVSYSHIWVLLSADYGMNSNYNIHKLIKNMVEIELDLKNVEPYPSFF